MEGLLKRKRKRPHWRPLPPHEQQDLDDVNVVEVVSSPDGDEIPEYRENA